MIRVYLVVVLGLLALAAGALVVALWPPRPLRAVFAATDCRRVSLADAASGREVVGAEDIVLSPNGRTLFVSAHDRRSGTPPAEGGLYAVPVSALAGAGMVRVEPLTARMQFPGGFRPHGIGVLDEGDGSTVIAVINRAVREEREGDVRLDTRIELFRFGPDGALKHLLGVSDPVLCRANNLAFAGPSVLLVTRDRQRCEGFGWREIVGRDGQVLRLRLRIGPTAVTVGAPETIAGGIHFANGIVIDPTPPGRFLVAATRAGEILTYPLANVASARRLEPDAAIRLPGGPDNLSRTAGGRILAAVHPNLLRLAHYRYRILGRDRAPSRIVALEPDGETITVLYDDPGGRLFSAASSAVLADGTLVAGSLADAGLLVCRRAPAS